MFSDDLLALAENVLEAARKARVKIAIAESCTGGLIAGLLTEIPGSSDVLDRGFITYSNASKEKMLGVSRALLEAHGAVSEAVARAMAEGAVRNSDAQVAVAVTGIAGPDGGTAKKPVGLVHVAVAHAGQESLHKELRLGEIGRSTVRMKSVEDALKLLLRVIPG
ncbi:MAG TPA: CinA family protein [Rhizomicrobium sp.]